MKKHKSGKPIKVDYTIESADSMLIKDSKYIGEMSDVGLTVRFLYNNGLPKSVKLLHLDKQLIFYFSHTERHGHEIGSYIYKTTTGIEMVLFNN